LILAKNVDDVAVDLAEDMDETKEINKGEM
jgi:hypothetical protein